MRRKKISFSSYLLDIFLKGVFDLKKRKEKKKEIRIQFTLEDNHI